MDSEVEVEEGEICVYADLPEIDLGVEITKVSFPPRKTLQN